MGGALLGLGIGLLGCAAQPARVVSTPPDPVAAPAQARPPSVVSPVPPTRAGRRPTAGDLVADARAANLVICVLDAARADRVGYQGYARPTTPVLDRLAQESVVFSNHFSPSSATKTSTASLFTGLYPDAHRVLERGQLPGNVVSLGRALGGRSWRTAVFSGNVNVTARAGLTLGFAEDLSQQEGDPSETAPEALVRSLDQWLEAHTGERFFAYLHFLPPHLPYQAPDQLRAALGGAPSPPPPARGAFPFPGLASGAPGLRRYPAQEWADLYDANLRWADAGVGEVVRVLRARGLLDRTLLVVTSDHGEAFGEHGYVYHMHAVYDELVHIPLLVRLPGPSRVTGRVDSLTSTVDVLPTVCDLCGIRYPRAQVQGQSLLPLLTGAAPGRREPIYAVSQGPWPSYLVREREWALILYRGGALRALYDLRRDPGQTRNVYAAQPRVASRLVLAFEAFARTQSSSLAAYLTPEAAAQPAPRPPNPRLSERTRRELEALGYLD